MAETTPAQDLVVVTWALRQDKHLASELAARELLKENPEAFKRLATVVRELEETQTTEPRPCRWNIEGGTCDCPGWQSEGGSPVRGRTEIVYCGRCDHHVSWHRNNP